MFLSTLFTQMQRVRIGRHDSAPTQIVFVIFMNKRDRRHQRVWKSGQWVCRLRFMLPAPPHPPTHAVFNPAVSHGADGLSCHVRVKVCHTFHSSPAPPTDHTQQLHRQIGTISITFFSPPLLQTHLTFL